MKTKCDKDDSTLGTVKKECKANKGMESKLLSLHIPQNSQKKTLKDYFEESIGGFIYPQNHKIVIELLTH
eukprot:scaffold6925_cov248-Ochromonas_danica.AAC.2